MTLYDVFQFENYDDNDDFFGTETQDFIKTDFKNLEYGDDLGLERLDLEYKLFTLNPLMIEQEQALELLKDGSWVYNESVISSIRTYLQTYLPKYIATYSHPMTKISDGNICFGVDDDGIIYGIPYMGNIPKEIIQEEINKIFQNNLRVKSTSGSGSGSESEHSSESILESYKNLIEIDIVPIKKKKFNTTNDVYQEYISRLNKMISKQQMYLSKKKTWENLIYSFTKKLHNMLNHFETRRDIIMFIKEKSRYQKKNFNTKYSSVYHLCDFRDYYDFISEIRSDFQYGSMKYETIEEMKSNPTNIFYWVTKWKDSKTSIIKSIKPVSPRINTNKNYPAFLLSQVHRMIPYWCTINPELNLYMIKIKISGCINPNSIIEYMDPSGNWNYGYRRVESRGPESIPLQQ